VTVLRTAWILVCLVAVWAVLSTCGLVFPVALPPPDAVASRAAEMALSGELLVDALGSASRVVAGFSVASLLAVALALLAQFIVPLRPALETFIELMRPIPPIAWTPLAILWLGIGNAAAVLVVALGAFFPVFVAALAALSEAWCEHGLTARGLGAGRLQIVTEVMAPAAAARILTGMRIGLGVSWTTVIAAELVGAQSGLGYLIQSKRLLLDTEAIITGMIVIGVMGVVLNFSFLRLMRFFIPWRA
jgi:ABC-type nitrate/sulfonate/bicarbonate transport system permease component